MTEADGAATSIEEVGFAPRAANRALEVEVLDLTDVLARSPKGGPHGERLSFHVLLVATAGNGSHVVDFEPVAVAPGTCLHIRPGQVHRFVPTPPFEARIVVWQPEADPTDPAAPSWYPGGGAVSAWQLTDEALAEALTTINELQVEQARFDGSPVRSALLRSLLQTLLLRMEIAAPASVPDAGELPEAYLELRRLLEARLHVRPSVRELADELGYSTRTLDRACQRATGRTAKQVVDERVTLEVRRLLTHTDRPVSRIARELGFDDTSNFSKFVKRQLGQLPTELRAAD